MLPDPYLIWLRRWLSLREAIDGTVKTVDEDSRFHKLLTALRNFGSQQFCYFFFGFHHHLLDLLESESERDAPVTDLLEKVLADVGYDLASDSEEPSPIVALTKQGLADLKLIENGKNGSRLKRIPQRLSKDYEFPPNYVLRTIIDQVAYDYEVIKRALHQHLYGTPAEKETLQEAERWSQHLLEPLVQKGKDKDRIALEMLDTMPITIAYFNRSPMIRMIPYSNTALIGIPLTATTVRRDLLATAHELGHYVYWHGQIGPKSVRKKLDDIVQGEMPYIKNWIEEIFADVFGFVISGEMAMLPFAIDMVADNVPTSYVRDGQIHPIDAVRSHIYIHTLRTLNQARVLSERQDKLWLHYWFSQHDPLGEDESRLITPLNSLLREVELQHKIAGGHVRFRTVDRLGQQITVDLSEVRERFQEIVKRIVYEVLTANPFKLREELILDKWKDRLDKLEKNRPPSEIDSNPSPEMTLQSPGHRLIQRLHELVDEAEIKSWFGQFADTLDNLGEQKKVNQRQIERSFMAIRDGEFGKRPLEAKVWKLVFAADGWAIKGPETGPVGGWEEEPDWTGSAFH